MSVNKHGSIGHLFCKRHDITLLVDMIPYYGDVWRSSQDLF
jgi:hypothetical protein